VSPHALLAVPGDLARPTGGYGYARRLLAEAGGAGLTLHHWPLPGGFPHADAAAVAEAGARLALGPAGWPVIVDGLALGVLPAEAIRAAGAPVIALCHHPLGLETGLAPEEAERLVASERAALAACAGVIATSRTTAALLSGRFGVPAERITVAPPGTDPAPQAGGSGGGPLRLLSVGSLTPRKGHDVLLRALGRLRGLDWRLAIVGDAPEPEEARRLAALAEAEGIAGRVEFAGAEPPDALAARHAGADLFVLASHHEGYGMAFAEAIARGLPVVGCDSGAVREATRGAARLVPPGDKAALAAALDTLIGDAEARAALGRACREAAEGLPRWPNTARAIAAAVRAALEDGPMRAPAVAP
jgi:glycosyltransferase involved in cell wall biosynthesis